MVLFFGVLHAIDVYKRQVESMIPRQGHRFGHILLCPLFRQRNAAGHWKLTFIKKK